MSIWDSGKIKILVEITSALAVVLSLVFVGLELRQNTAATSGQVFFQLNEHSSATKMTIAQDPELASLVTRGNDDPESLTELEQARYIEWTRARFNFLEAYWVYRKKGLIDDSDSAGMQGSICDTFAVNGTRWTWRNHLGNYTEGFVDDVEKMCFQ